MNKKILVISLLAVFMLVAISLVSAVSTNTVKPVEKKDSPLFGIRLRRAIGERLQELREHIKAKFIGERLFFLPFQWLRNRDERSVRQRLQEKTDDVECTEWGEWTCQRTVCTPILCTIGHETLCGNIDTCDFTCPGLYTCPEGN